MQRVLVFILFIVLFPIIPAATSSSDYEKSSIPIINPIASQGMDPIIYINTDSGFSSLGLPGDGTESNPYVIEDMQIVSAGFCISIIGTVAYFIIRNCTLSGGGTGIRFILVDNARIENCTFIDLGIGIEWNYLTNSSVSRSNFVDTFDCIILSNAVNCVFEDIDVERNSNGGADFQCSDSEDIEITVFNSTSVYNNTESFYLSESNRVSISYLSTGNPSIGIMVLESSYIEILNSSITGRLRAVQIYLSSFCTLRNSSIVAELEQVNIVDSEICAIIQCTFISKVHGQITLDSSENCLVQDCNLLNSSLKILGDHLGYYSHIISNVTNNGEEIGYFLNTNSIAINMSKYYQVFIISCQNVTSKPSSVLSELFSLDIRFSDSCNFDKISITDNIYSSINIADSQNIEMSNFSMNRSWYGVNIRESSNICIVSAMMFENALDIWQSSNVSVFNSDIDNLVVFWSFNSKFVNSNMTELYVSQSSGCQFLNLQIVYPVQFSGSLPSYWLNTFNDVYVNSTLFGYFYNINNANIDPSAFGQVVIAYCSSIIMAQYTELFSLDIFDSNDLFISDIIIIDGIKNGIQIYDSVSVYFNQISFEGNSSFEIITSSEIWIVSSVFVDSRIYFSAFGNYIILDSFFTNCVIELNNIQNLEFARNTVNSGIGDGIHIARVGNAEITNNTFTTSDSGIRGMFIFDSKLSFNQIDCNLDGIVIEVLSNLSIDSNSIFNAKFGLNFTSGSLLEIKNNQIYFSSEGGIQISNSQTITIEKNIIYGTGGRERYNGNGMIILDSGDLIIHLNILQENQGFGILLTGTTGFRISGNFFQGNRLGDAYDSGDENYWYGNCWFNQEGSANITITGPSTNLDISPLTLVSYDIELPQLTEYPDLVLTYENESVFLSWIIWTINTVKVKLTHNDQLQWEVEVSEPHMFIHSLADLPGGIHNFTLSVFVNDDLHVADVVMVDMREVNPLLYTGIASLGILGILLIIEVRRRVYKKSEGASETVKIAPPVD